MSTRRTFIKQMGMLTIAAAMPSSIVKASKIIEDKDQLELKNSKIAVDSNWDVIVVGGGPAGCTAAISAAREGARTLIIEAMGQLGGMGTIGMVPAWTPFSDGEKMIYRGLAKKVFDEAKKGVPFVPKGQLDWVPINPEYLISVYDNMVMEVGVSVLFFSRVCSVKKSANDVIDALIVANKSGLTAFKAKVFIDATGDGDVAAWAGASFKRGFDDKGTNQSSTLCFSIGNVDAKDYVNGPKIFGSPKSVINQVVALHKFPLVDGHCCNNLSGPDVIGFNAGHLDLDTSNPWEVSKAMINGRKKAAQYLEAMKYARPSTFSNAFLVKTAPVLGVRESRRILGDYVLTADDWRARRTFEDEIGRNCYYIDIHGRQKPPEFYHKGDSHGIPYRCLTPKGFKNLLTAGRCISSDAEVFGSIRIMPCCLVTGEAAGMAAKHAIDESHNDVHQIDVKYLRKRLKEEGQYFL